MIKIACTNCIAACPSGDQHEVDPHEALKALEEQAPKVLQEYIIEKLHEDDERCEAEWEMSPVNPFEKSSLSGINPWRKVEDEEPPKDGTEFLVEYPGGEHEICYWDKTRKDGDGYFVGDLEQEFDVFAHGIKWMPIPGGEE